MTIIIDEKEYSFPDYTLNYLDYRDLDNCIKTKIPQDIFNSLLNDLDCTKEFSCGRPMMTNYPMYARNINAYFYILETLNYTENNDEYKEYINKLIDVHTKNIKFEINNPYIPPITKSKKSKRKIITYKIKDLITGEDTFLIQDIKTKKYKVNKNPNVLDKPKKYTGRDLSEMYFDFTNKEEY